MPDSVVVIGCGPGGLFFCHALETKRREMLARGESVENLPNVTVFERASSPGGVWRSERTFGSSPSIAEEKKDCGAVEADHNTQMVSIPIWKQSSRENRRGLFRIRITLRHNGISLTSSSTLLLTSMKHCGRMGPKKALSSSIILMTNTLVVNFQCTCLAKLCSSIC